MSDPFTVLPYDSHSANDQLALVGTLCIDSGVTEKLDVCLHHGICSYMALNITYCNVCIFLDCYVAFPALSYLLRHSAHSSNAHISTSATVRGGQWTASLDRQAGCRCWLWPA